MERIELHFPAGETLPAKALAGVVGSGDLEALFQPAADGQLQVIIRLAGRPPPARGERP